MPHGFAADGRWAAVNVGAAAAAEAAIAIAAGEPGGGPPEVAGAAAVVVEVAGAAAAVVVVEAAAAAGAVAGLRLRQSYDQDPPEIFEHSPFADQIPMSPSTHSDIVYRREVPSAFGLPSCPQGFDAVGSCPDGSDARPLVCVA